MLLERFRAVAAELIPPGAQLLVGYSGGPDSTCLIHMMHRCGLDIVAAHLHHGQRQEADVELNLAEAWCEAIGVPLVSGRADVPQIAEQFGIGLEEAGRRARYSFFEQAAGRLNCNHIVTAHTSDDHVETILLNVARGSGLGGLRGIPQTRGIILRPLLGFSRSETQAYCEQHALWTHDDPSNTDLSFSRARIRLRVIPELERLNPEVRRCALRMAEIIAEEDDFLNSAAATALERLLIRLNGPLEFLTQHEEVAFDAAAFKELPRVLGLRAIRLAAASLGAETERSNAVRIWEGESETLPGGQVAAQWCGDRLHFRSLVEVEPFRHSLTIPGETIADSFGWQITAFKGLERVQDSDNLEVGLDADALSGNLYFRSPKEGERMASLGMTKAKLISDLLQEKHLTGLARRRLPIVCDLLGPVWIPGVCIADRAKCSNTTKQILRFKFGPVMAEHAHNSRTDALSEA